MAHAAISDITAEIDDGLAKSHTLGLVAAQQMKSQTQGRLAPHARKPR